MLTIYKPSLCYVKSSVFKCNIFWYVKNSLNMLKSVSMWKLFWVFVNILNMWKHSEYVKTHLVCENSLSLWKLSEFMKTLWVYENSLSLGKLSEYVRLSLYIWKLSAYVSLYLGHVCQSSFIWENSFVSVNYLRVCENSLCMSNTSLCIWKPL